MLVPRPDKCAVAALNCKVIQGGTRVNQDLMHGGGRPYRDDTGDSPNLVEMTVDDDRLVERLDEQFAALHEARTPEEIPETQEEIDFTGLWHSQHYSSV